MMVEVEDRLEASHSAYLFSNRSPKLSLTISNKKGAGRETELCSIAIDREPGRYDA